MNYKLVVLLLSILLLSNFIIVNHAQIIPIPTQIETTLKQVIMLVRHGGRAPLYSYPTDPYGPSYWERYGGLGQITSRGLFESYILGQFFKNYYVNFLTPAYSPARVHVRSVDSDSCLMGAMSFLSGMYPPANSDQLWSPQVSWFPIPVHTEHKNHDTIFVEDCPKYEELLHNVLNSAQYMDYERQFEGFIKNMSISTGLQKLTYNDLWKLYDNAISKANNGVPLEPWLSDSFQTLAAANDHRVNLRYGDVPKAKLVSGALLFDIGKQLRRKTSGSASELYIYSCEDSHMSAMLTLLNATSHLDQIPFASVIALELSQDTSGLYYVTLKIQSNTTSLPITLVPMRIGTCGQLCSLGNFFDLNAGKIVSTSLRDACLSDSHSGGGGGQSATITTTTKYPTSNSSNYMGSGCMLPGTNGTVVPYAGARKGYTKLEVSLIIVCSILAATILGLIVVIALICYRNKIRKASF